MREPATTGVGFRASRGLTYLAGFGAFGAGVSAFYAATGIGLPCPFRIATGWDCPLCGGTRVGVALLHGDVTAALSYNPVVALALVAATVLGLLWVVEALGGPAVRLPAGPASLVAAVRSSDWLVVSSVGAVLFILVRNLG